MHAAYLSLVELFFGTTCRPTVDFRLHRRVAGYLLLGDGRGRWEIAYLRVLFGGVRRCRGYEMAFDIRTGVRDFT